MLISPDPPPGARVRDKVVTAADAVRLIRDGDHVRDVIPAGDQVSRLCHPLPARITHAFRCHVIRPIAVFSSFSDQYATRHAR